MRVLESKERNKTVEYFLSCVYKKSVIILLFIYNVGLHQQFIALQSY